MSLFSATLLKTSETPESFRTVENTCSIEIVNQIKHKVQQFHPNDGTLQFSRHQ